MTKQFSNYSDLLTFTRASKGHALRPVSYGTELVTNGDGGSITDWSAARTNSTVSVNNGRLRSTAIASGAHGIAQTLSNLTVGAIYFYSANVYADGGSGNMIFRVSALSTLDNQPVSDEQSTTRLVSGSFVATASTMYVGGIHVASSAGDYIELDNVSIKEVTFDKSDGTLTLFEHPNNVPRVEWDAQRNRLGLLVEESRTNLFARSDAKEWTVSGGGTTTINTDLTLGAFTGAIRASGGQDWHRMYAPYVSVTSGTTYTITAFFKYGTSNNVLLNFRDTAGSQESRIIGSAGNLTNSLANAGTVTILQEEALPNAVRKVVVKYVPDFSGSFEFGIGPNSTTSGETVIPLAAQCEQASFGTSYIKTTGATATRSSDFPSIPVADFGFNSAEGTVVCELQHFTTESVGAAAGFALDDGSSSNRLYYYQNKGQWIGSVSGTTTLNIDAADTSENTATKVAVTYKKDDFVLYRNGSLQGTDTSSEVPAVTTFFVGNSSSNTELFGHIKSIKYYPRRLTNAQLQEITT